jgi:hypothetical protein
MLLGRVGRQLQLAGLILAVAVALAAAMATTARAERVGNFYCIEYVIPGAFEDCVGASKFMVRNLVDGSHAVCAGAFYPNENRLFEEYNCGGLAAEQNSSGAHLRPVVHNHGTANNQVIGWVEYLT